jgi:glycosyltransferase involved in cell wall biosynthesis
VCILTASDTFGGAEIHTVGLVATLVRRGHEVVIVESNLPVLARRRDLLPAEGVVLLSAPGVSQQPAGPRSLHRILRSIDADVGILVKGWTKLGSVALDLACRAAFRGRFLTIEHSLAPRLGPRTTQKHLGGLIPGLGLWWHSSRARIQLRSLFPTRIVTVSGGVAHRLIHDYRFPNSKVIPIPNGVDENVFKPDPELRAKGRAVWGVPSDAVVFGVVSRLSIHDKGIDVAINCFSRVCAANPDQSLWCVLIGTGDDDARLRTQARDTPASARILFAGPTERPWEAYPGMDVVLVPSRVDGLSLSLLEAMASGCVPIVTGVGGNPEVMTDPSTGWLVPPEDDDAFCRAMQAALDLGPEARAATGARARRHVVERFRAADQYRKVAETIEQCTRSRARI